MNKTELIATMAEKSKLTKKEAEAALKAFIETVEETLEKDDKVQLVGFGTFEPKVRKARTVRNPRTGEPISLDETTVPTFKAGKEFKEKLK